MFLFGLFFTASVIQFSDLDGFFCLSRSFPICSCCSLTKTLLSMISLWTILFILFCSIATLSHFKYEMSQIRNCSFIPHVTSWGKLKSSLSLCNQVRGSLKESHVILWPSFTISPPSLSTLTSLCRFTVLSEFNSTQIVKIVLLWPYSLYPTSCFTVN